MQPCVSRSINAVVCCVQLSCGCTESTKRRRHRGGAHLSATAPTRRETSPPSRSPPLSIAFLQFDCSTPHRLGGGARCALKGVAFASLRLPLAAIPSSTPPFPSPRIFFFSSCGDWEEEKKRKRRKIATRFLLRRRRCCCVIPKVRAFCALSLWMVWFGGGADGWGPGWWCLPVHNSFPSSSFFFFVVGCSCRLWFLCLLTYSGFLVGFGGAILRWSASKVVALAGLVLGLSEFPLWFCCSWCVFMPCLVFDWRIGVWGFVRSSALLSFR